MRRSIPYAEHPKKPPTSKLDELHIPYIDELRVKQESDKPKVPLDATRHKRDFNLNINQHEAMFSDKDYFKTVHLGGDDVLK